MKEPDTDQESLRPEPKLVFGTVSGCIGVICSLNTAQYTFLLKLQKAINEVIHGVGGFSHADWRSFRNERRQDRSEGFIDGDLIESFLNFPMETASQISLALNAELSPAEAVTVDKLIRQIEELARLH